MAVDELIMIAEKKETRAREAAIHAMRNHPEFTHLSRKFKKLAYFTLLQEVNKLSFPDIRSDL